MPALTVALVHAPGGITEVVSGVPVNPALTR
ncbi:hypothetical protein J2S66_001857 [Saccharothrix longispora]|uniref:Uncharacterized protein n=1 Tax=Saccharothrix longispora TaxID=33920 RepID=A0ABU1PT67_9PSEU|nr:hypothetical protein [Saccharothrix longispora]